MRNCSSSTKRIKNLIRHKPMSANKVLDKRKEWQGLTRSILDTLMLNILSRSGFILLSQSAPSTIHLSVQLIFVSSNLMEKAKMHHHIHLYYPHSPILPQLIYHDNALRSISRILFRNILSKQRLHAFSVLTSIAYIRLHVFCYDSSSTCFTHYTLEGPCPLFAIS